MLFEFKCTKCNMAGVLQQAGNAYLSGAPGFTHSVLVGSVLLIVFVSCVVFCCLRSVSCLSNVTDVSVLSII